MSDKVSMAAVMEADEGYADLEGRVRGRIGVAAGPLFETDASPEALWDAYLSNLPADRRQHYNCHACRRFVQRYGGLVTIDGDGGIEPAAWDAENPPAFFAGSVYALRRLIFSSRATGVFLSSEKVWGTPQTGAWGHLAAVPASVYADRVKTAAQAMAEKLEDYKILSHGLSDYPKAAVQQAVRVLQADALSRSEKTLGVAEWLLTLHTKIEGIKGPRRSNTIWAAVASAPPGFCHVRSTMISTLLDDIVAGLPFDDISRRWADKMHPLRYQRPTAAPSAGAIEQAEKLVERLGVARSLERRFARLDDVPAKLWTPRLESTAAPKTGGVFDHLRQDRKAVSELELPAVAVTWEKFRRTVLPDAVSIEVRVPHSGGFYGLVTAADPEAPAIIQWDGLVGHPRNPASWYFYHGGSPASRWNLGAGGWAKVTAIFLPPHQWQEPAKFSHHAPTAFFAIEGCYDTSAKIALCLFPEILKSEFHGIRSVVEAHSHAGGIQGAKDGTANGLALQSGGGALTVRAKMPGGLASYTIDRWD